MSPSRTLALFAFALSVASVAPSIAAAETRYVTIFDETVEGASASPITVEATLGEALLAAGAVLVDEAQSKKIRSVTSAGELVAERIPDVVTTLDADVLVAGVTKTSRVKPPALAGGKAVRFETHTTVKLIAVDSAQIVDTVTLRHAAVATSDSRAVFEATRQTAELLAKRILEAGAGARPELVELTVESFSSIGAVRRLRASLLSMPEVDSMETVHASLDRTEYQLRLAKGYDVETLTDAIETSARLPLTLTAFSRRSLRGRYDAKRTKKKRGRASLEIQRLEVDELFPGRAHAHATVGVGEAVVKNAGRRAVNGAVLRARVLGVSHESVEVSVPRVPSKKTVRVPVRVSLDPEMLARHRASRKVTVVVDVVHGERVGRRTAEVELLGRHAISWKDSASVAAFVTPEAVEGASRSAVAAIAPVDRRRPLARAAAFFEVLRQLRYQRDAVYPGRAADLDRVQLPGDTLALGHGDCDDLSVLLASLSEAAGHRAAFLLTPGHVLVAIDTGLPAQSATLTSYDRGRFIALAGRAWVPIETTHAGTFGKAWAHAAETVRVAKKSGDFEAVIVQDAWKRFPPVTWPTNPSPSPRTNDIPVKPGAISAALRAMDASRKKAWAAELTRLEGVPRTGQALNERGLLLIGMGRRAEAKAVFSSAVGLGADAEGENNLANVYLMNDQLAEARSAYTRALRHAPRNVRVRLNAAVAARLAGDEDAFADALTECLEAPGGAELVASFLASIDGFERRRGATSNEVALGAIASSIRSIARARGVGLEGAPTVRSAEARPVAIERIVFWLR